MVNLLSWVNVLLAALGSLAAFGALNKMQVGRTKPCMALAMLLIAVGLFGETLGAIKDTWEVYLDTALFGGVAALLLATQKVPTWLGERFANPLASIVAGLAAAAVLVGMLSAGPGT
jgi:uncharacterized membrane protein YedE/YeeE